MQRYWLTVEDEVAVEITRRAEALGCSPSRYISELVSNTLLPGQTGLSVEQLNAMIDEGLKAVDGKSVFSVRDLIDLVGDYRELSRSERMVCAKKLARLARDPESPVKIATKVGTTTLYRVAEEARNE